MDPDWRCMDPIENGDNPASYVSLPEERLFLLHSKFFMDFSWSDSPKKYSQNELTHTHQYKLHVDYIWHKAIYIYRDYRLFVKEMIPSSQQKSNEKNLGWLGYVGDEKLPSL